MDVDGCGRVWMCVCADARSHAGQWQGPQGDVKAGAGTGAGWRWRALRYAEAEAW